VHADLPPRLVVKDLDAAALKRRGVVEGDLVERIAGALVGELVANPQVVARVEAGRQQDGGDQRAAEDS